MKPVLQARRVSLSPEQRDLLRKQIDARMRERLGERGWRRIASPGGYVPKPPKQAKS
jgi:hypothetical protein